MGRSAVTEDFFFCSCLACALRGEELTKAFCAYCHLVDYHYICRVVVQVLAADSNYHCRVKVATDMIASGCSHHLELGSQQVDAGVTK